MERATGTEVYGCGSPQSTDITLNIQTTTGGNFSISLNGQNTVEHLKKIVSKKLKVSKDRICLLHRERQLRDGTLEENGVLDGSRVILLPSVETGLLSQRTENSVMQALESLNDSQVNDFLTGRSPLNLTMRLGDHMMLIQLQLSTLNSSNGSRSLKTSTTSKSSSHKKRHGHETKDSCSTQNVAEKNSNNEEHTEKKNKKERHHLKKKDLETLQNAFDLYRSMAEEKYADKSETNDNKEESMDTSNCTLSDLSDTTTEQSPIKSLSNLVSSPIDTSTSEGRESLANSVKSSLLDLLSKNNLSTDFLPTPIKNTKSDKPKQSQSDSSTSDDSDNFADQSSFLTENPIDEYPMENLFNNAVDKGLFEAEDESMMDREISNLATTSHGPQEATAGTLPPFQSLSEPLKSKRFQYLLHKTSKFKHPAGQSKQKAFMQSVVNKHKKRMQIQHDNLAQPSTSRTEPYITSPRKLILQPSTSSPIDNAVPSTSKDTTTPVITTASTTETLKKTPAVTITPNIDTKALIEASKNLTQKLKKLSREVLTTNKVGDMRSAEETVRARIGSGAVIESMKHHGKGIYSGTFSGTLNPALQDRHGRPKRDISTIIHILNDLLCATPPMNAFAQKETSHSCSSTSIETTNKCLGCSQASCSYGQCDGHLPSTSTAGAKSCTCDVKNCQCSRLDPDLCSSCSDKSTTEVCKKCDTAKTLALENSKTKCKLEQLRLVMQQKKQRREARKLKTMPYSNSPTKTLAAPEPTTMQEEIETAA